MSPEEPLVLAAEFPPVSAAQWRAAVDRVLAGKDSDLTADELARRFTRQLVTTTRDGIRVDPLYTAAEACASTAASGVPGFWPFVRGASVLGGVRHGWDVRQVVELGEAAGGPRTALEHLEGGATSLLVRPGTAPATDPLTVLGLLDPALDGVYLDLVTIALDTRFGPPGASALVELWQRRGVEPAAAAGVLGLDPLGEAASAGGSLAAADVDEAIGLALVCAERWPAARAWVVDATRYHEAGASDVEELACATATGLAYLRLLVAAGLDLVQAFTQLEFRLAATADQFSTMAKLRAARRLWARVAQYLGVPGSGAQRQHVLTSRSMLTRYDPWVNLLRNTTACFAAGTGGADAVTVEPHDLLVHPGGAGELGRRMARNTQLLLLEESHLARVLDPAGGSWYVEWLTDAMARAAWEWTGEIEAAGGMAAALGSGLVQERIERTWQRRGEDLDRRVDIVVGVSDYPNLDDRVPLAPARARGATSSGGLARHRYAEAFEALRVRTDSHEGAGGARPCVLLVRLGPAGAFTARATYAKSFFETAGLRTATHDAGDTPEPDGLRRALDDSGATVACVCSSDPLYVELGAATLGALRSAAVARAYVATRPGPIGDSMLATGADELVYAGCDVRDALERALDVVRVP